MNNFDKYRLELEKYANNPDNKRQDYLHTMSEGVDYEHYKNILTSMGYICLDENTMYDEMGDEIKKYEKWLEDGEF